MNAMRNEFDAHVYSSHILIFYLLIYILIHFPSILRPLHNVIMSGRPGSHCKPPYCYLHETQQSVTLGSKETKEQSRKLYDGEKR